MASTAYRLVLTIAQASGFWKVEGPWSWLYIFYQIIVIGGLVVLSISELVALHAARSNLAALNDIMCTSSAAWLIVLKAAFLFPAAGRVADLQTALDHHLYVPGVGVNARHRAILDRVAHNVRMLTLIATVAMNLTAAIWALFPLIDGTRKLPLPFWWPGDLTLSPVYEVVYVYHVGVLFAAALCLAATDAMFCSFLMQTAAHYDLLVLDMTDLASWLRLRPSRPYAVGLIATRGLAHFIRHHKAIIRCVKELEEIYRGPVMVEIVTGTILVCVSGFEIFVLTKSINSHILSRLFYMLIALTDLFILCAQAELIIGKSEKVAKAAYNLPWERLKWHHQHAIRMIIARARHPPHISVGRFVPLSLATYLSVLKTAYSLFSLLRQVAAKP